MASITKTATSDFMVVKREGHQVEYDRQKITKAVYKCLRDACDEREDNSNDIAESTSKAVERVLISRMNGHREVTIEQIQDLVETQLMAQGHHEAAKQYILYRDNRRRAREEEARNITPELKLKFTEGNQYFKGINPILQQIQAFDKFSRFRYEWGRREVWPESVYRTVAYFQWHAERKFPGVVPGLLWQELHESLLHLQASPSMRSIQMAGPALERCQVGVYNCSFLDLDSPTAFAEDLYVLMQGTGVGFGVEDEYAVDKWPRVKRNGGKKTRFVVEDWTEGWCDSWKFGIETWMDGGEVDFDTSGVRKENTPLRIKGGRASGPGPLIALLNFGRSTILSRQNKKLTSLNLHDMACMTHRIVQMGGVRRASGISHSDLDDLLMRHAKRGSSWMNDHPHRNQANNSAVYEEKPTALDFAEEWIALGRSGSGERGIFNAGSLPLQLPTRRKKVRMRCNPCGEIYLRNKQFCVSGDTRLITKDGVTRIEDSVGKDVEVWNGESWSQVAPIQTGEDAQLFRVEFSDGSYLDVTGYHSFSVSNIDTRHKGKGFIKRTTLQLKDTLHRRWGTEPFKMKYEGGEDVPHDFAYDLGFSVGDGHCPVLSTRVHIPLYGEKDQQCPVRGVRHKEYTPPGYNVGHKVVVVDKLITHERIKNLKTNPDALDPLFSWSRASILAFIAGWVDADGSETGTGGIRLYLSVRERAERAQLLLTKCGIRSSVCLLQEEGTETNLGVRKKDLYYLQITDCSEIPCHRVDTSGGHEPRFKGKFQTIRSILPLPGKHKTFCFEEPIHHKGVFGNTLTYQCNLSIAIIRATDTKEEIRRKVILATIWGTLQASMTDYLYLTKEWKENSEEEALLGVDLLGHLDHPLLRPDCPDKWEREQFLDELTQLVIDTNREWAHKIGINPTAAGTCGKPAGDSSVFFDTAAGFKPYHGKYYKRRLRFKANNPIAKVLEEAGVPHSIDYDKSGLLVFEIPARAPENAILLGDQTAIQQLENWLVFKLHWTEHNPSVTIYVRDHEWLEVGNWIYAHWDQVGGLAFFPYDDSVYPQAPYETIDEREYNRLMADFPTTIDWSRIVMHEESDMTELSAQYACTGDRCDI